MIALNFRKKTGDSLLSKKNSDLENINAKALETLKILNRMKEHIEVSKGEEKEATRKE